MTGDFAVILVHKNGHLVAAAIIGVWNRLFTSSDEQWQAQLSQIDDPRQLGYQLQLDNAGADHSMPDFADALSVQTLIENILAA